jgi:RNA polymerase sigma-70 factor (ECF subfamily)
VRSGSISVGNHLPNGAGAYALTPNPRETRIASAKTPDDVSFASLIGPSKDRVYRLALNITRNGEDAEDVEQETMLKVHRKLRQFEGRSLFTTWISRIAINEALMCLRKRPRAIHVSLEAAVRSAECGVTKKDLHVAIEGPEAAYWRKELRHLLTCALRNLPPANRIVFLLRTVKQLSTIETANALQISASAVKARMRRARNELRKNLKSIYDNGAALD